MNNTKYFRIVDTPADRPQILLKYTDLEGVDTVMICMVGYDPSLDIEDTEYHYYVEFPDIGSALSYIAEFSHESISAYLELMDLYYSKEDYDRLDLQK